MTTSTFRDSKLALFTRKKLSTDRLPLISNFYNECKISFALTFPYLLLFWDVLDENALAIFFFTFNTISYNHWNCYVNCIKKLRVVANTFVILEMITVTKLSKWKVKISLELRKSLQTLKIHVCHYLEKHCNVKFSCVNTRQLVFILWLVATCWGMWSTAIPMKDMYICSWVTVMIHLKFFFPRRLKILNRCLHIKLTRQNVK